VLSLFLPFYFLNISNCLWSISSSDFLAIDARCSVILWMNSFSRVFSCFRRITVSLSSWRSENVFSLSLTRDSPTRRIRSFRIRCLSSRSRSLIDVSVKACCWYSAWLSGFFAMCFIGWGGLKRFPFG
jgi:hypothetical protein